MKVIGGDGKEPKTLSIRDMEAIDYDDVIDKHLEIMGSIHLDRPVMRKFDPSAVVPLTEEQREFMHSTLAGIKVVGRTA